MKRVSAIRAELRTLADPDKVQVQMRFFKTGPGDYGEGDRFLGVVVPKLRALARAHRDLDLAAIEQLLHSPYHEERQLSLLLLVDRFRRAPAAEREQIYGFYLASTRFINNWDLVDASAAPIVGAYLADRDRAPLCALARSESVWERRIAMIATYHDIRQGSAHHALRIAVLLVNDEHDLIHKAVGWMLREIGTRCSLAEEEAFLRAHYRTMPRTMLRYAIEKLPEARRRAYLEGKVR